MFMFRNIGRKIKLVSATLCYFGVVLSILYALDYTLREKNFEGIIIAVFVCLLFWVGSLAAYGLGELIESSVAQCKYLERQCELLESIDSDNKNKSNVKNEIK